MAWNIGGPWRFSKKEKKRRSRSSFVPFFENVNATRSPYTGKISNNSGYPTFLLIEIDEMKARCGVQTTLDNLCLSIHANYQVAVSWDSHTHNVGTVIRHKWNRTFRLQRVIREKEISLSSNTRKHENAFNLLRVEKPIRCEVSMKLEAWSSFTFKFRTEFEGWERVFSLLRGFFVANLFLSFFLPRASKSRSRWFGWK